MNAWIRFVSVFILNLFLTTVAHAGVSEYSVPPLGNDIVGQTYPITVERGDSLTTIRQENDISYEELLEANPRINFYKLKVGQTIIIPKQFILPKFRRGIVINIPELRLYYFTPDGQTLYTFPVGLGRENWRTPLISSKVASKEEDPVWRVPNSIREYVLNKTGEELPDVVMPGPKNPLGKYALRLQEGDYLIHGTNAPTSVGTFISSGCMRLLREPIELLYEEVAVGTPVHVMHCPTKAGWRNNKLYVESHIPVSSYTSMSSPLNVDPEEAIYDVIHLRPTQIDWNAVSRNVKQHLGIPEVIGYQIDSTY